MMNVTSSPAALDRSSVRLTGLWIALVVLAVFWTGREIPNFDYALLMDDDTNILFNEHLGELDGARLWWMFTDMSYVARYMPLGWLSFNLVAAWSDLSPMPCHIAGVVIHAINAVMVLLCLRRLLRLFMAETSSDERTLGAGLGALLWALHPLRVEPVAWCSGLLYVVGGFFSLLTVYARLRELEARGVGVGKPRGWFAVAAVAYAFSLLVYPVALFLPGVIAVLDYGWRQKVRSIIVSATRQTLRWELTILALMAGVALWATLVARQVHIHNGLPPPTLAEFGLIPRIFQAGYVWASYVWRTLWPVDLTPGVEALFEMRASDARIWGAFPMLILLTALAWRWRRSAPYLGACWLAYLFWMIPVLGLTEHPHVAADRYSYLVSVLFSVGLVFGILRRKSAPTRGALFGVLTIMAMGCACLSLRQARLWYDASAIHRHVLTRFEDVDLRNITLVRMAKLKFLAGDVRGGRAQARKIYAAAPQIAGVERSWREMAPPQPLSPEVEARPLQEWRAAPWACLHERIAVEQLKAGRTGDARVRLDAALVLSPDFVEARFRRALVLAELKDPHAALHDWLIVESRDDRRAISVEGMRFAAGQIAAAFRAAGDEHLALALERRATAKYR